VDLGSILEGFLELPVLVVLGAMWLACGALLGGCVLAPHFLWTVLA
jgi:hypothetical protein